MFGNEEEIMVPPPPGHPPPQKKNFYLAFDQNKNYCRHIIFYQKKCRDILKVAVKVINKLESTNQSGQRTKKFISLHFVQGYVSDKSVNACHCHLQL